MKKLIIFSMALLMYSSFTYSDSLTVSFATRSYNGVFAPRHCLAIWINNSQDKFVKSLKVCANFPYFGIDLVQWIKYSAQNRTDAITSASLNTHQSHTVVWDCKDLNKATVPNGIYKVYAEFTEDNSGHVSGVRAGEWITYDFTKGANALNLSLPGSNYFTNFKINYKPSGPPDTIPPSTPTGLTLSNIGTESATLKWTASTDKIGVIGYEVFKDGTSIGSVTGTSINIADLVCGSTYKLTVKASDGVNLSLASLPVSLNTLACVPGAEITVNDKNTRIKYIGSWIYSTPELKNINDDEHYTNSTNDNVTLNFIGTSISWLSTAFTNRGIVDVFIDNIKVSSVDTYSPTLIYQKVQYSNSTLSNGSHTIKLVNTGAKNAASIGTYLILDAFKYTNPKDGAEITSNVNTINNNHVLDVSTDKLGNISFNTYLPISENFILNIYDVNGNKILSTNKLNNILLKNNMTHNGIYFATLKTKSISISKKFMLIR